jgi:putative phosphoesterase
MTKIGLLSDTHNYLSDDILNFLKDSDEIWHAGDIGNFSIIDKLQTITPVVRAVYGNIDGQDLRKSYPKLLNFKCENVSVTMTHIGGYPNHYPLEIYKILLDTKPDLFICGHSHILKIIYDKKLNMLHINPGAAGLEGFHIMRTAIHFVIDENDISQLRIWEKKR